jgi:hypothetical protein
LALKVKVSVPTAFAAGVYVILSPATALKVPVAGPATIEKVRGSFSASVAVRVEFYGRIFVGANGDVGSNRSAQTKNRKRHGMQREDFRP